MNVCVGRIHDPKVKVDKEVYAMGSGASSNNEPVEIQICCELLLEPFHDIQDVRGTRVGVTTGVRHRLRHD